MSEGQVALVTGGSRGIGRAIAVGLARAGMSVAVNYRADEKAAAETVAQVVAAGGEGLALQGDVGDASAAEGMVKAAIERWGRLDVLVNNAGINRDTLVMRMSDEDWESVMRTSLDGAFYCTRPALLIKGL